MDVGIVTAVGLPAYRSYIDTANMAKTSSAFEYAIRQIQQEFTKDTTRSAVGLQSTLPTTTEEWITLLDADGAATALGGGPMYVAGDGRRRGDGRVPLRAAGRAGPPAGTGRGAGWADAMGRGGGVDRQHPGLLDSDSRREREPECARRRLTAAARAAEAGLPLNMDAWDGYPAARGRVFDAAQKADANLVVLAGDTHNAWAFDLTHNGAPVGVAKMCVRANLRQTVEY